MISVPWLDPDSLHFPNVETALEEPNGLLAIGGDLSAARLVSAYRSGIFPWYEQLQPILWWSPDPRTILFPDKVKVSRSLAKHIRRGEFTITGDRAFSQVMHQCAITPRNGQQGTWITAPMLAAYSDLHKAGIAHSIEIWHQDSLVGGLYGLAIGRVFFGESMFSHKTNASKVAFVALCRKLWQMDFAMIDCQVSNPHLFSLGAEEIDRSQFCQLLVENIDKPVNVDWGDQWDSILDPL